MRAHGHKPTRHRGKLTTESRAAFKAVDLHVHDLRREFASRLLESSADLHDVQMFAKLEADGFAHHSHTATSTPCDTADESAVDHRANTLN